jgi:hypothetical protein
VSSFFGNPSNPQKDTVAQEFGTPRFDTKLIFRAFLGLCSFFAFSTTTQTTQDNLHTAVKRNGKSLAMDG